MLTKLKATPRLGLCTLNPKLYRNNSNNTTIGHFQSYLVPLFQTESSCKTFHMKMSLICMKMNLLAEIIFN